MRVWAAIALGLLVAVLAVLVVPLVQSQKDLRLAREQVVQARARNAELESVANLKTAAPPKVLPAAPLTLDPSSFLLSLFMFDFPWQNKIHQRSGLLRAAAGKGATLGFATNEILGLITP